MPRYPWLWEGRQAYWIDLRHRCRGKSHTAAWNPQRQSVVSSAPLVESERTLKIKNTKPQTAKLHNPDPLKDPKIMYTSKKNTFCENGEGKAIGDHWEAPFCWILPGVERTNPKPYNPLPKRGVWEPQILNPKV